MIRRPFIVLDRDGTIVAERNYLADPEQVRLIAGAADGLRRLAALGAGLVVITNQSGVARGIITPSQLDAVHRRLEALLAEQSIRLDGIFTCPHRPEDHCDCRKPRPALLDRAARELHFDPARCFIVGDKACDIGLGRARHATTILVRTGYGAETEAARETQPDHVVDDLRGAADVIGAAWMK